MKGGTFGLNLFGNLFKTSSNTPTPPSRQNNSSNASTNPTSNKKQSNNSNSISYMAIFIGILAIVGISLSIYLSVKPNNGFCDLNDPNNIIIILIVIIAILIYKKY
jgi:hypothetical protein